jgi:hypothetical protein
LHHLNAARPHIKRPTDATNQRSRRKIASHCAEFASALARRRVSSISLLFFYFCWRVAMSSRCNER